MRKQTSRIVMGVVGAAFLFAGFESKATSYTFEQIKNGALVVGKLSPQLSVDIKMVDSSHVSFLFENNVGISSSITEIYFDGGFMSGPDILSSAGVSFAKGANPADLPAGNTLTTPFVADALFNSQSVQQGGQVQHGINASSEWLLLTFQIDPGFNVFDKLAEGELRIGLHVTGMATSEAYLSVVNVPDGGTTIALLGMGVLGFGVLRRKLSR